MAYSAGTGDDDRIQGTRGEDLVFGLGGDDTILTYGPPVGGGPFAAYRARAADRADLVLAGDGDDRVEAGGGADVVDGGAGDDIIAAGAGADTIMGGAGDDVFVFGWLGGPFPEADTRTGRNARDVVLDFEPGGDLIDLSGYGNASAPGAVWLGTGVPAAGSQQLQVGYRVEGALTVVEFYAPTGERPGRGVPRPTGEIELVGLHQLMESDFIL